MKIPQGMTEQQVVKLISDIAEKLAPKYTFGFYDREDIKQEAIIIGLQSMDKYEDSIGPLQNFLVTCINNRLKSFKRDNYMRYAKPCSKCNNEDPECKHCLKRLGNINSKKFLIEPLDISGIDDESESNMWHRSSVTQEAEINEYSNLIDKHLPIKYRSDYLKIKAGIHVDKQKRIEIEEVIQGIIGYYGV